MNINNNFSSKDITLYENLSLLSSSSRPGSTEFLTLFLSLSLSLPLYPSLVSIAPGRPTLTGPCTRVHKRTLHLLLFVISGGFLSRFLKCSNYLRSLSSLQAVISLVMFYSFPSLYLLSVMWRCPWCNGYRRRKWTRRHEFKSWTRLIAFHIALIPLGKVWIQLFSLQLWVNSRTDWFLQPWWGN